MAEATIRAEIVSELKEISTVNYVADREGLMDLWVQKKPQEPFIVVSDADGISEEPWGIGKDVKVTYNYQLRVFMAYNKERDTKSVFKLLLENIRAKFRVNVDLNNTANHAGLVQLRGTGSPYVELVGGFLCHFAVFRFPVWELKLA